MNTCPICGDESQLEPDEVTYVNKDMQTVHRKVYPCGCVYENQQDSTNQEIIEPKRDEDE